MDSGNKRSMGNHHWVEAAQVEISFFEDGWRLGYLMNKTRDFLVALLIPFTHKVLHTGELSANNISSRGFSSVYSMLSFSVNPALESVLQPWLRFRKLNKGHCTENS